MKLLVPDNGDPDLVKIISELVKKRSKHHIGEIYGKPTSNIVVGSGRANVLFEDISKSEMIRRVKNFQDLGIMYNYTLNGILPRARVIENRGKIIEELEWVESSPITRVTVANYELAKLANKYSPNVDLCISIFADINNKELIKQWSKLQNVKVINLGMSTFRNIPLLKELVDYGKKEGVDMSVTPNLGCMTNCIRKEEHAIIKDMASIDMEPLHYGACTFYCRKLLLENPVEFLKLPIIRPEDIEVYERIGIVSAKLVDRTQKTKWIKDIVEHYMDGSYNGNILDLTCNFASHQIDEISDEEVEKVDIKEVIQTREGVFDYKERLPRMMNVEISHDYDFLGCNNTCNICNGCEDPSKVIYDKKRVKKVLGQLKELEELYLFK